MNPYEHLQEVAEEIYRARAPGCLARAQTLLLTVGTPAGGRFTRIRGEERESVEPVDPRFLELKCLSHAPLGLFGALFPRNEPRLQRLQSVLVGDHPIVSASLELARRPTVSAEDFRAYAKSIHGPVQEAMREAAKLQLEGIRSLLDRWSLPADSYAAVGTGWARVNNSPRYLVLAERLPAERLFVIQGAKTEEALLEHLGAIFNHQDLAELFFGDRYRLDEDIMGRPVAELLQER